MATGDAGKNTKARRDQPAGFFRLRGGNVYEPAASLAHRIRPDQVVGFRRTSGGQVVCRVNDNGAVMAPADPRGACR
jgi:hypothetical protein